MAISNFTSVNRDETALNLAWANGKEARFPFFWLRDHCPEPESLNVDTWQREVDTFSIPLDIEASSYELDEAGETLSVTWSNDGFKSRFPTDLLYIAAFGEQHQADPILWDKASLQSNIQTHQFKDVMNTEEGLDAYLKTLEERGFAIVEGMENNMECTRQMAERIAYIRESIFGGLWDFKADQAHSDTAYSTVGIGPHTDSTYSHDAPGLQMLHCIEYKAEGGLSVFADGFKVAEVIKNEDSDLFDALTTMNVTGRYLEPGVNLQSSRPVVRLDERGNYKQVSYNNFDRAPVLMEEKKMKLFYRAIRRFNELVNDPEMQVTFQLVEGKAVIFDNWRVLHARTSFAGIRHMAGAYFNHEDFESKIRVLRQK
ncbi:trimethyllysine dioxygenase [Curvivirga aplysinae]|uniref:trimethyllysine dioxygenase n=1 Tax=Curvivirga aplysinae TaxID=2529852 RepID=UPI0012BC50DE|nr:trimethyllysine dioxygenase [Curvivirga aplysinae]MTI08533.1 trimethyllysine dioxygenase [Curvivirga aplysinae]